LWTDDGAKFESKVPQCTRIHRTCSYQKKTKTAMTFLVSKDTLDVAIGDAVDQRGFCTTVVPIYSC
jgi:riboflavin synthase alpha subunit